MKRNTVLGLALIAAGVVTWAWSAAPRDEERDGEPNDEREDTRADASVVHASANAVHTGERSLPERLLGPIASFAASLQWVRVDDAWNHGRPELADRRAEFALELAPGEPGGWLYYARHLIYDRASRLREPLAADRERWVRAGLAVLDRGERECRAPGAMAFQRGVVFLALAEVDDVDRALPISRREAWLTAAEAFDRAAAADEPLAREAAEVARRRADDEAR